MPQFPFLSDEWIVEARRIRDELVDAAPSAPPIRMNLVVTEVPFGSGTIHAHVDSSSGTLDLEHGHLAGPDVSVSTDYATTKALFVDQNPQAAMQAFMSGKIRVQGDLAKLMALQPPAPSGDMLSNAQDVAERIRAITL